MTSKNYKLAQAKLGALFEQLQWSEAGIMVQAVWCQTFTWDIIESNLVNTFPRDMKLDQSE